MGGSAGFAPNPLKSEFAGAAAGVALAVAGAGMPNRPPVGAVVAGLLAPKRPPVAGVDPPNNGAAVAVPVAVGVLVLAALAATLPKIFDAGVPAGVVVVLLALLALLVPKMPPPKGLPPVPVAGVPPNILGVGGAK